MTKLRIALEGKGRIDERPEIGIRFDPAGSNEGGASLQHRRFADIPANLRQQGQLGQRPMKGSV
jgi:hypothetical protein